MFSEHKLPPYLKPNSTSLAVNSVADCALMIFFFFFFFTVFLLKFIYFNIYPFSEGFVCLFWVFPEAEGAQAERVCPKCGVQDMEGPTQTGTGCEEAAPARPASAADRKVRNTPKRFGFVNLISVKK